MLSRPLQLLQPASGGIFVIHFLIYIFDIVFLLRINLSCAYLHKIQSYKLK